MAEIYFALKRKDSTQLPVLIDARRVGESGKYSNIASFVVVNNRQQFEGALLRALRSEQAAREETERKSAELDGVNVELRQHRDALIAAEAELRRSNESKDEFIGLVAHELKNPLSILSGTVSIVARRVADQPLDETRHTLEELHGEFARLLLVIENLLGVARSTMADSSELEPLILPRLVSRLVSRADLAIGPGGPIVVQAEPDLPLVLGSEPLVVQILHNFLTNARKYGTDGSEITVSIRRSGDTVEIAVANDGQDLDEREVARFFEAFYRAEGHRGHVKGTGLGLTVCQRLAAAQGGSVAARPRPNGGLEVTLSLRVLHEDDEPD